MPVKAKKRSVRSQVSDEGLREVLHAWDFAERQRNALRIDRSLDRLDEAASDYFAREDRGWTALTQTPLDLRDDERSLCVNRSRLYFVRDGDCRQLVQHWTNYCFGAGISAKSENKETAAILDDLWYSNRNRNAMSYVGQTRMSNRLLVDGELFIVFFPDGEQTTIRTINPLEITERVTDPEDSENVWGYKREFSTRDKNQQRYFYPDLSQYGESENHDQKDFVTQDGYILHVPFMPLGWRGNGLLFVVTDWAKADRQFMEARLAIQRALAQFPMKEKIRGTKAQIQQRQAEVQSGLVTQNAEKNPPPAPGARWIENQDLTLSAMDFETGAAAAQIDGNMLLRRKASGANLNPLYVGAGEAFRLATASAMELPILKTFQSYQYLWRDTFERVIDFALAVANVPEEDWQYDVGMPQIVATDAVGIAAATVPLLNLMPEYLESAKLKKWLLDILGAPDAQAIVDEIGAVKPGAIVNESLKAIMATLAEKVAR